MKRYFIKGFDLYDLPMFYQVQIIYDLYEHHAAHGWEAVINEETLDYILANYEDIIYENIINSVEEKYEIEHYST